MISSGITSHESFLLIARIRSLARKDLSFTMRFLERYRRQVSI